MQRLFLLLIVFVFSCSTPEQPSIPEPADLIPEDKMVLLLADVHLLEATLALRAPVPQQPRTPIGPRKDTAVRPIVQEIVTKDPIAYYDIFSKHGVTRKQYESSMQWYSSKPEQLNELYDKVMAEVTKRQAQGR